MYVKRHSNKEHDEVMTMNVRGIPPVSAPSNSGFPPSTLAAMLFTMLRMASVGRQRHTHTYLKHTEH